MALTLKIFTCTFLDNGATYFHEIWHTNSVCIKHHKNEVWSNYEKYQMAALVSITFCVD